MNWLNEVLVNDPDPAESQEWLESLKAVIDGAIVLVFLIYVSNSYKLPLNKLYRQKKARALAEQTSGIQ